ncbi:MAG: BrnT family toxin [Bacteroidetes bacterium]|nr:MAG: BrnT family toxin [Bacteroidota bacterium]
MDTEHSIKGFEWDPGNQSKNYEKHGVSWLECEQVFFNKPIYILPDIKHSSLEDHFYILGQTNRERLLLISFTLRNDKIRVVSARDMNKKERSYYNEKAKENS